MRRHELDFEDYNHIFTKTKKEFIEDNKINDNNFTRDVNFFIDNLGLDPEAIRADDGRDNFQFSLLLEPIIAILIKGCKNNPVYKKNKKISINDIIEYNKNIFKEINKLPEDLKYDIKQTESYHYNYKLNILLPMLVDRLDLLFKLVISETNIENGDGIVQLIKNIDEWIVRLKEEEVKYNKVKKIVENNNSELEFDLHYEIHNSTQDGTNSLIDSALKSCYNNQIGLTKKAREKFKKEGIKSTERKMSREEMIHWTLHNGDLDPEDILSYKNKKYEDIDLKYRKIRSNYDSLKIEKRLKQMQKDNHQDFKEIRKNYLVSIENATRIYLHKVIDYNVDNNILNDKNFVCEYMKYLIRSYKVVREDIIEEMIPIIEEYIMQMNKKIIKIKKNNNSCFDFEYDIQCFLVEINSKLEVKIKQIDNIKKNVYKEVLEEFKNSKDNLNRVKIKDALSLALGQAITESLYNSKELLRTDIYYLDEIEYFTKFNMFRSSC